MSNPKLIKRLEGIHAQLLAAYEGSLPSNSNTKGQERERFIDLFLSKCLPPHFRFGSGEITDSSGQCTGQLDIVIEKLFFPSFPLMGLDRERLYCLEGVSAVIEVKSNLTNQWTEVKKKAEELKTMKHLPSSSSGRAEKYFSNTELPFVVVGFRGWPNLDTLAQKRSEAGIAAILQLDPLMLTMESSNYEGVEALASIVFALADHLTAKSTDYSDLSSYFS